LDLIGVDKQLTKIREWLEEWKSAIKPAKKALLLIGPPGVGKTSSVYKVAKDLELNVCEYNMSDTRNKLFFEKLVFILLSKPIIPTVFLLDECDGVEYTEGLRRIIHVTRNPLIFTANNYSKVRFISEYCEVIWFNPIPVGDVAKIVGEIKDYSTISGDVRQSLMVKIGSMSYQPQTNEIEKYFRTGQVNNFSTLLLLNALDNAHLYLYGYYLYEFISRIVVSDRCRRVELLEGVVLGNRKWEWSYFLSKLKKSQEEGGE